jgi:hypothetical protein
MNNLKQLAMAATNFATSHGRLPNLSGNDPKYSRRVLIPGTPQNQTRYAGGRSEGVRSPHKTQGGRFGQEPLSDNSF